MGHRGSFYHLLTGAPSMGPHHQNLAVQTQYMIPISQGRVSLSSTLITKGFLLSPFRHEIVLKEQGQR